MQNQMTEDELAYSQAFNEEPGEVAETDVMPEGVDLEAEQAQAVEAAEELDQVAETATTDDEPAAAPPVDALVLDVEQEPEEAEPTDPKDIQRAKSWEGRLRAREAELAAREQALKERERAVETVAEEPVEPELGEMDDAMEERVGEVAAAVEDGSITYDEAAKILSEDFGDEFARLVLAVASGVASKTADEKIKALDERIVQGEGTVATLIAEMSDDRQRRHFEAISSAHPDFVEIAEGEMMRAYLDSLDEADRKQADAVIATGSATQIIKLLDAVKSAAAGPKEEPANTAADDAEGVRSRGLRIPEAPRVADGYEEAWAEF